MYYNSTEQIEEEVQKEYNKFVQAYNKAIQIVVSKQN